MSLEQKLLRMQEILDLLEQKKVSLSDSMPLLLEANTLRKQILGTLTEMENQIISLSKETEEKG
ncbi:MAG: exodeoxyribonuclease VII small subunit [Patescibacteria group bacterium]